MLIFEAENKKTPEKVLREAVLTAAQIVLATFLYHYFSGQKLSPFLYVFEIIALLFRYAGELTRPRVSQVVFNPARQEIVFHYRRLFGQPKEKATHFSETRVEVQQLFGWRQDNIVLHFIRGKLDLLNISATGDGFLLQSIEAIRQTAEANGMKVSAY